MGGLTKEYVIRRLLMFVLTVWVGATIIFFIPRLAPGDPVQAMVGRMTAVGGRIENADKLIQAWRVRFGLDKPLYVQYFHYIGAVFTGDLGYSLASFPTRVSELIGRSLPWTIGLLSVATVLSFTIGNLIGALLGWRRTNRFVKALLPFSLTFTSIPFFMLAILLIYIFGFGLKLFPISGGYGRGVVVGWSWSFIVDVIYHAILPAFAIVISSMGFWALGMRGMMISADSEDYLILAQAKGLSPTRIFWQYSIRTAILPQVTALALTMGGIVGGSTLVEYLFAYPGMGYQLYQGITSQDYTVIQGICFYLILATALAVLIIDLIYPLIDPRISYQRK